jgi:CMP-N-acetylneuraminic acid synthetase
VVVSTDDDEIADIAEAAGAWVPFRRHPDLADDHTPTVPVIVDAIERVEKLTNNDVGDVLVAYPAAVFMTVGHISNARAMLHQTGASIIMSAAEHPAPILRSWRRKADGSAEMIWPEYKDTRSQDLEPTFYDAGQFYWWSSEVRIHLHANEEPQQRLYQLMPAETQDIDTEQDWLDAENKWAALFEDVS